MFEKLRRAFIDRIEDGQHAVLLVDDSYEVVVPAGELPEGATGGTWLRVRLDGNRLIKAVVD